MDISMGKSEGKKHPSHIDTHTHTHTNTTNPQTSQLRHGRARRRHSPHGVQQRAVVLQTQQLVGRGHVVGDGLLPVVEERVWSPDFAGEEIVERKALHGPFKPKPFVFPALSEKHVDGVFLAQREARLVRAALGRCRKVLEWSGAGRKRTHHLCVRHGPEAGDVDVRSHLSDTL